MDAHCIRHTDLPHTSKLFADYLYHFDRVARFYAHSPFDAEGIARAAAGIEYPAERRAELVASLAEQNPGSPSLELLAREGTVAVVTGQQVGLFSGPAYTIYKALTAARMARRLSENGIPAVPVFWLATEDHDFAEVDHSWVFDDAHRPVKLQVINGNGNGQHPVGRIAPREFPVEALRELLRGLPFGDEAAALVEASYAPGRTMGEAFRALLQSLVGKYGVLFLDPLAPAVREIAAPMLRSAVQVAPEIVRDLLERNKALEAAGYHAQVHVEEKTSLVFLLDESGRRIPLRRENHSYAGRDRRFTPEALAERAAALSPNALLRPVIQDYILPTLAYVAGPAELAYLAQSAVIYGRLLGRMPVVMPRAGFTLLDEGSRKLMDRYGLRIEDFFGGEEALRERVASRLIPPDLARRFREATEQTTRLLEGLRAEVKAFDPTLDAALGKSEAKMLYQLGKMERKVAREALRRQERASGEASRLYSLIYPNKHLQERVYSILPFLARHGLDLLDRIYEGIHLDCPDHIVRTV
ncbi:MAG: bacillithiol biosynthesis cysteine-adding enzyme BshC [Bryobacteraceae bacterium]